MTMLATVAEMASKLGVAVADLDSEEAERSLGAASARVEGATGYAFSQRTSTISLAVPDGYLLAIPLRPLISVQEILVEGTTPFSSYTVQPDGTLFAPGGWWAAGSVVWSPALQVTCTYGLSQVPDDVKELVLEMAILGYEGGEAGVTMEAIDDYRVQYGATLSPASEKTLTRYGGSVTSVAVSR